MIHILLVKLIHQRMLIQSDISCRIWSLFCLNNNQAYKQMVFVKLKDTLIQLDKLYILMIQGLNNSLMNIKLVTYQTFYNNFQLDIVYIHVFLNAPKLEKEGNQM